MFTRNDTLKIDIGGVKIGGGEKIALQSMTNTKTDDVKSTVAQIKCLEDAGCEIVRVAVPDMAAAEAVKEIKKQINIPLVTDIHFDYRLALECMKNGADKVRINPGNIGDGEKVKAVVDMAKKCGVPIRIGVNGGSLEKNILQKHGKPCPAAIVESAMAHIKILEDCDFYNIAVSLKTSSVNDTIESYRLFAENSRYPLHLGVTEAGNAFAGTVKSSVGIGALLAMGIGDTLRVSLTAPPEEEIKVGKQILKSLDLIDKGVEIISCPTCGRCNVNLQDVASRVEKAFESYNGNITVAVMGCAVNGPGEAREADVGVACGKGEGLIFKKGEIIKKVKEADIPGALIEVAGI